MQLKVANGSVSNSASFIGSPKMRVRFSRLSGPMRSLISDADADCDKPEALRRLLKSTTSVPRGSAAYEERGKGGGGQSQPHHHCCRNTYRNHGLDLRYIIVFDAPALPRILILFKYTANTTRIFRLNAAKRFMIILEALKFTKKFWTEI